MGQKTQLFSILCNQIIEDSQYDMVKTGMYLKNIFVITAFNYILIITLSYYFIISWADFIISSHVLLLIALFKILISKLT